MTAEPQLAMTDTDRTCNWCRKPYTPKRLADDLNACERCRPAALRQRRRQTTDPELDKPMPWEETS